MGGALDGAYLEGILLILTIQLGAIKCVDQGRKNNQMILFDG